MKAQTLHIKGSCFCGQIELQAEILRKNIVACHCKDCQKFSGAPFRVNLIAEAEYFHIKGQISEFSKIADSGNERIQGFCGTCGSNIYATDPDRTRFNIRAGCITQNTDLIPARHIFAQSAQKWLWQIDEADWHIAGPESDVATTSIS